MNEILTQEEIDSLLSATAKGAVPTIAAPAQPKRQYMRYDFRRPNRISKEQLQALQMLHDRFAKEMGGSLSPLLRAYVEIRPTLVLQMTYVEYSSSLAYPACLGVFKMKPLKGGALIEIQPRMVLYIIDRILGGPGHAPDTARELTEIERALISRLLRRILNVLQDAWNRVSPFQFELLNLEVNPGFLQLTAPTDMAILVGFDVKIGEVEGTMSLCFPFAMLEPIVPNLSLRRWIASHRDEDGQKESAEIVRTLPSVGLDVRALLGSVSVSIDELLHLKPGDIMRLEAGPSSFGVLEVEGIPKYAVKIGTSNRRRAVEIVAEVSEGGSAHGGSH